MNPDQQVATIEPQATAMTTPGADYVPVAGITDLSPDDFSIPVLKLIQSTTKIDDADKHAGKWYRSDTGEIITSPQALIIGIAKSRVLFPSDYTGDGVTLCRSDDGHAPRVDYIGSMIYFMPGTEKRRPIVSEATADKDDDRNMAIPAACADCPLSQWGTEGGKPPCRLSDNWAALLDEGDPALIRFGGSAAKMSAKLRNLARAATAKRKSLYIALSAHFEKGDSGNYWVPDITPIKETVPADLIETAKAFMGLNLAARAADLAPDGDDDRAGEWIEDEVMPF
jgi:hypothetical protein